MLITNPIFPLIVIIPVIVLVFVGLFIGTVRSHAGMFKKVIETVVTVLICICIYVINLRIMLPSSQATVKVPSLNVLFVMDSTISMWAEDYDGDNSRMDGAIEACNYIMDEFNGSSFALITFDHEAKVKIPLTPDRESITDALEYIYEPSMYVAKGSDMNSPVDEMSRILTHMKDKYENRETIVFFFSDGEETFDSSKESGKDGSKDDESGDEQDDESSENSYASYARLIGLVDGGAIVGVGSEDGTTMKDGDGNDIYDPETGDLAVSCIGEESLESIASKVGLEYVHMEDVDDLEDIVDHVIEDATYEAELRDDVENKEDTYYYVLPILMILLVSELMMFRK